MDKLQEQLHKQLTEIEEQHDMFSELASNIFDFVYNHSKDEFQALKKQAYSKDPESAWQGYLYRMIPNLKYDKIWTQIKMSYKLMHKFCIVESLRIKSP